MIWSLITESPLLFFVWLFVVVIALTFHEYSHALTALWCGDRTAERMGRLTLNPLSHLDPWGALLLLFVGFGWAKPVPYNPYQLRNPKRDSVLIALAGPASNICLAIISAFILRGVYVAAPALIGTALGAFLLFLVIVNLSLALFNLIPVPPLDGSKVLLALLDRPEHASLRLRVERDGPKVLLGLVLLSFLTPIDPFGWLGRLVGEGCYLFTGFHCSL